MHDEGIYDDVSTYICNNQSNSSPEHFCFHDAVHFKMSERKRLEVNIRAVREVKI